MKRPLGISFISYFYIFGAFILLFSLFFYDSTNNQINIASRIGLPNAPEKLTRVIVAILSLAIAYGFLKLRKWGFWLMITYSIVFGLISYVLVLNHPQQPFIGNMIWSFIVLSYTIYQRRAFFQRDFVKSIGT